MHAALFKPFWTRDERLLAIRLFRSAGCYQKQSPRFSFPSVRVVLDTTILVRAKTMYELARMLRYPWLRALYGLSENLLYDFVSYLREVAEIVKLNPFLAASHRNSYFVILGS